MAATIALEVLRSILLTPPCRWISCLLSAFFQFEHTLGTSVRRPVSAPGCPVVGQTHYRMLSEFDACESRLIFTQGTMNLGNLGSSARVIMAGDGPLSFSSSR